MNYELKNLRSASPNLRISGEYLFLNEWLIVEYPPVCFANNLRISAHPAINEELRGKNEESTRQPNCELKIVNCELQRIVNCKGLQGILNCLENSEKLNALKSVGLLKDSMRGCEKHVSDGARLLNICAVEA